MRVVLREGDGMYEVFVYAQFTCNDSTIIALPLQGMVYMYVCSYRTAMRYLPYMTFYGLGVSVYLDWNTVQTCYRKETVVSFV